MKLFWQLWLRQVALLSKLEARFHNAGHTNVRFIIVTRNETNIQRIRNASRHLQVITVNGTQISQFSSLEDRSIYIFDDCGRIVYIIHYPYSSVQKPFVKAAVLSTIYDRPCGRCSSIVSWRNSDTEKINNWISIILFRIQIDEDDEISSSSAMEIQTTTIEPFEETTTDDVAIELAQSIPTQPTNSEFDETTTEPTNTIESIRNENEIVTFSPPVVTTSLDDSTEMDSSSYASYVVPLKIILPVEHVHKSAKNDSFERFNYILLKVDDVSYHEHIYSDNSDFLFPVRRNTSLPTLTSASDNDSDIDSNTEASTMALNSVDSEGSETSAETYQQRDETNDNILVDSQGYRYKLGKHYQLLNEYGTAVVEFDDLLLDRSESPKKKTTTNQITKRVLNDDDAPTTKADPHNNKNHEQHYAKIFQWLHYHL